jgi:hypothetical protein
MLGVRPTYDGLLMDPVLPGAWKTARMLRRFRGAEYDIQIEASTELGKNQIRLYVDGAQIPGNLIKLSEYPEKHEVRVIVGTDPDGAGNLMSELRLDMLPQTESAQFETPVTQMSDSVVRRT